MSAWPIQNMYEEVLSPEHLDKPRTFERQELIKLNLLSIFIAVGATGSYKTNSVLQIFLAYGPIWDSVTLSAKCLDEPLYNWFKTYLAEQKRQGKIKWYRISDDLAAIPPLDRPKQPQPLMDSDDDESADDQLESDEPYYYGKEKHLNHCIIADDMIMESPKKLAVLNDAVTRGRKFGITLFVLSQCWYRTPLYCKRNATYFVLKSIPPRALKRAAGDITDDITAAEFVHRYKAAMVAPHDFFLIDRSLSTLSQGNHELMFRRNLG
jgi:hypothetical protein